CGFTGGFTTVVWLGRDDATPMRRVTGGGAPAELWRGFMTYALKRIPAQPIPPGPPAPEVIPPPAPTSPTEGASLAPPAETPPAPVQPVPN
ncbi:MAG TPA: penicillin-binding protein, partial [Caulobacteraceae bacterium]|nr:penicillin-binding protein [Caulobacteraceae bacterium]